MSKTEDNFTWEYPGITNNPSVKDGDIRLVNLPVQVGFEWSDKIVSDWDENGDPLDYTSGYIMRVLPDQSFIYNSEESMFIGASFTKKPKEQ